MSESDFHPSEQDLVPARPTGFAAWLAAQNQTTATAASEIISEVRPTAPDIPTEGEEPEPTLDSADTATTLPWDATALKDSAEPNLDSADAPTRLHWAEGLFRDTDETAQDSADIPLIENPLRPEPPTPEDTEPRPTTTLVQLDLPETPAPTAKPRATNLMEPVNPSVNNWTPAPTDRPRTPPKVPFSYRIEQFIEASRSRQRLTVIEQLRLGPPKDWLWGWVTTLVITGIAFFIRWWNIGYPTRVMFDETFYAKDAYSLLQYGYGGIWRGEGDVVNPAFAAGDASALATSGSFIVHPPLGEWLIASGMHLFGLNSFGWRFGSLIFGTLLVFAVIRLTRRLSRSTLIGGIAGVLLTVDGLAFVMSRIALLDIFQAFFLVAAVSCVVADRDFFRHRLAKALAKLPGETFGGKPGPFVFRPWLIGAGLAFGCACACKWNSIYPLAVFGIMVVVWSISARHLAGARGSAAWALLKDGVPAFISMVVVAFGAYLLPYIPWLRTTGGYDRDWGASHLDDWVVSHFGTALGSLWHYHVDMYNWHTGETMANATHRYASSPWGWPMMTNTVGIMAENDIEPGDQGCTAAVGKTCLRVITGLGTPLLWWLATIAILIALVWWLAAKDGRFSVPVLGMFSTWIPWILANRGAEFTFYAITMIPFMVLALAMVLGVVLGPADGGQRRQRGGIIVGTIVALIILNFAFNYPIYTAQLMTRTQWQMRMWLPGWV